MFRGVRLFLAVVGCAGSLWIAGCTEWGTSEEEDVEETTVSEVAGEPGPLPAPLPAPLTGPLPGQSVPGVSANPVAPTAPAVSSPVTAAQKQWPLVKTVTQQLRQQSPDGWVIGGSTVELSMMLAPADNAPPVPEAASGGSNSAGVAYHVTFQRVRVSQKLPGQPPVAYDSASPAAAVPPALRPWQGLAYNGFGFHLDGDRQLTVVTGVEPFLEKCLLGVPAEQRPLVRATLPTASPFDWVACFVDESLGLLPAGVSRAGDNWIRSRNITQPSACVATTRYTLRQVTAETADVDMSGTIDPVTDAGAASLHWAHAVEVRVRSGQLLGQCRVDRSRGLPIRSHVEQSLETIVRYADGKEFPQLKTTITTLEAPAESPAAGAIIQAGAAEAQGSSSVPGRAADAAPARR